MPATSILLRGPDSVPDRQGASPGKDGRSANVPGDTRPEAVYVVEERYKPYYELQRTLRCRLRAARQRAEQRRVRSLSPLGSKERCASRLAPRRAHPSLPEPAWAPLPSLWHSANIAPALERFTPGEARYSTRNEQLAADLRTYGCHQRADGTFIESYTADLAVWLQLTPLQRLAARLHDWTRPRQAPPLQHTAPRGEVTVHFMDQFGQDSAGNPVHTWTSPAVTRARNRDRGPNAGKIDWVEANEEPNYLYGKFRGHQELFVERAAEREMAWEQGGEEGAWWEDTATAANPDGSGELDTVVGETRALSVHRPVGLAGMRGAPSLCPTCHHALPRCFCVCDQCGVELGHCDCNERFGISASYLEEEDAHVRHLSAADRARIVHEMTLTTHIAEDREQHERHEQEKSHAAAERAAQAAVRRQERERQATRLPYCFCAAVYWQCPTSSWGEPLPADWAPAAATALAPVPPDPHDGYTCMGMVARKAGKAGKASTTRPGGKPGRGRPMARPRRTPYTGCVLLYADDDPSWQARAFRRRYPWGIPRDRVEGKGGWREWVEQEEDADQCWQTRLEAQAAQRAYPAYDVPRVVMEVALRARLEADFAQLLESLRPLHSHPTTVSHPLSHPLSHPPHEPNRPGSARHKTRVDTTDYPYYRAVASGVVARLSRAVSGPDATWIPPDELLPAQTGLWLPTHEVAQLWGIQRDSVCAWHRDHPEALTDKNGVRELHFHLEDVVQRANEKAHATDRCFPWRRTA